MTFITLTSDWQTRDYYSGKIKGRLLKLIPDAIIADISHNIDPFHILQATFLFSQAMEEFPDGTIHLFLVNQGVRKGTLPAVVRCRNQFIIGWDDGNLGLVMADGPDYFLIADAAALQRMDELTGIAEPLRVPDPSFPELSLFTRIAAYLAAGFPLSQAGPHNPAFRALNPWLPVIHKDRIDGQVVHIDSYGNAITNIPKSVFLTTGTGRPLEIIIKSNRYKIFEINRDYLDSDPGELLAIFNSAGLLEIAIGQGNAAELLGFEAGTSIKIKFDEQKQGGDSAVI
jgi:S-adenosylmethionine hydrolase